MSRIEHEVCQGPPKLTKLKHEENQPPLEAYVSDLFSPLTIPTAENKTKHTVTPGNVETPVGAISVGPRTVGRLSTTGQIPKDDTRQRRRRRSTGEPSDVSATKKQIKTVNTGKINPRQVNNPAKTTLTGVKNQPSVTLFINQQGCRRVKSLDS